MDLLAEALVGRAVALRPTAAASSVAQIAEVALELATRRPELVYRNPENVRGMADAGTIGCGFKMPRRTITRLN